MNRTDREQTDSGRPALIDATPAPAMGGRGRGSRFMRRDLTTGSIPRNLWGLAWPQVIEGALRVAQQFMDLFWAGFLGTRSIAGVGVATQWVQLVWTGRQGIDQGTRAMVARAIGRRETALASHVVFQGLTVNLVFLAIISVGGVFLTKPMLQLLGVSDAVMEQAVPYMRIQFIGQGVLGLQMYGGNSLAASGDTITPMRATMVSRTLQMILSPLLIFGVFGLPHLGIMGISLAGSTANLAGMAMNWSALMRGNSNLHLKLSEYRLDWRMMLQMVKVGGPAAYTGAERSIAQLLLVGVVAPFGDSALAAYTLTRRLEMFVNLGSQGLGNASGIIVGQNLGAGNVDRARRTVVWAAGYVFVIKGIMTAIVFVAPQLVLGIFAHDKGLLDLASMWVRIQAVSYLALGVSQVATQSFNTAGDTLFPMLVLMATTWLVQQPLAHFLPYHWGLGELGVAWAITISVMVRPVVFIPYFLWGPWYKKQPLGRERAGAPSALPTTPPAEATAAEAMAPAAVEPEPARP